MKLTNEDISRLCRSLSLLLHAGAPLSDGIELLLEEEKSHGAGWMKNLALMVQNGAPLWESMASAGVFSAQMTAMVRIGEETGRLEQTLDSLADYYEDRSRTAKQVRSCIAYPGMVMVMMMAVIGVLLVKVLPVFDAVYASLGSGLTGLSGALMGLGQGLERALPVLLAMLAAAAGAAALVWFHPALKERSAKWLRRSLGDRGIARKFNNAQFVRGLSLGMGCGLPLDQAVQLAEGLLEEIPGAARRCAQCAQQLEAGAELSQAMTGAALLSAAEGRLLALGIRSGKADQVLEELAGRVQEEARQALEDRISCIEPAMVLAASVMVGIIILSVMLPLMDILSAIG